MGQVPHRVLRQDGVDVGDLGPNLSFHGCYLGWGCEDDALCYACQYRISAVALADSAEGQKHVSRKRRCRGKSWRAIGRRVSAYDWRGYGRLNLTIVSGLWSGGFWKSAGANEQGAHAAYQNTTWRTRRPALGSSHERLTCTTHLMLRCASRISPATCSAAVPCASGNHRITRNRNLACWSATQHPPASLASQAITARP
jgi:hypothetical protein